MKTFEEIFEDLFFDLTKGVVPKIDDSYPHTIFYCRAGSILIEHDSKTGHFWVNNDEIWKKLEMSLALNYHEVRDLLKGMLEKYYNLKEITPYQASIYAHLLLEKYYNLKEITPYWQRWRRFSWLEKHYNLKEIIPPTVWQERNEQLEKYYNLKNITPFTINNVK